MLYYLHQLHELFGPLRVFEYISVRSVGGAGTAFFIVLLFGNPIINWLRRLRIGQHVRDDEVLKSHRIKEGTPTMGGVIMLLALSVSTLLWARIDNVYVVITLATTCWMGLIGFIDDYRKVVKKNSRGLRARTKLVLQFIWCLVVLGILWTDKSTQPFTEQLMIPFIKEPVIAEMGLLFTLVFMTLVLVGSSNAVNLTDGMDGLAVGCTNSAALAYLVMAYVAGRVDFSSYLQVPYIPGTGELAVYCGCLLGAGLGFLWFNCHPAKVFMGDTGSLALGGGIAMVAILIKQELALVIVGGVFVIEAVSVLLQVGYFKLSGGKRIFRCAPIHHHFELIAQENAKKEGLNPQVAEAQVTTRFWIVSIVFAILGLVALKIR